MPPAFSRGIIKSVCLKETLLRAPCWAPTGLAWLACCQSCHHCRGSGPCLNRMLSPPMTWGFVGAFLCLSILESLCLVLSQRHGRRTNRYNFKAIKSTCDILEFLSFYQIKFFSVSLWWGYSWTLVGGEWERQGTGWCHLIQRHWNRSLLSDQVWWALELGLEGCVKFAAEILKSCQLRAGSGKLPSDPDPLLSWRLYLLRWCWLTALLFSFLL